MTAAQASSQPAQPATAGPIPVPVSPGELLDRLSILEIKHQRITDLEKLAFVEREYAELQAVRERYLKPCDTLSRLYGELRAVNEQLWDIENQIRQCEARQDFGPRFVELARAVYQTNDRRSALKRRIDELLGSMLVEQKDYTAYE